MVTCILWLSTAKEFLLQNTRSEKVKFTVIKSKGQFINTKCLWGGWPKKIFRRKSKEMQEKLIPSSFHSPQLHLMKSWQLLMEIKFTSLNLLLKQKQAQSYIPWLHLEGGLQKILMKGWHTQLLLDTLQLSALTHGEASPSDKRKGRTVGLVASPVPAVVAWISIADTYVTCTKQNSSWHSECKFPLN